jgi:hypothetical protein
MRQQAIVLEEYQSNLAESSEEAGVLTLAI